MSQTHTPRLLTTFTTTQESF